MSGNVPSPAQDAAGANSLMSPPVRRPQGSSSGSTSITSMQRGFTLKRGKLTGLQTDTPKRQHLSPGYAFLISPSPVSGSRLAQHETGASPAAGEATSTPVTNDPSFWSRGGLHQIQPGLGKSPFSAYMETLTPLQQPAALSSDRLTTADGGLLPSREESDFCAGITMRPIALTPAVGQRDHPSANPSPRDEEMRRVAGGGVAGGVAGGGVAGGDAMALGCHVVAPPPWPEHGDIPAANGGAAGEGGACRATADWATHAEGGAAPYATAKAAAGAAAHGVENLDAQLQSAQSGGSLPTNCSLATCETKAMADTYSLVLPGGLNLSSSFDAVLSQTNADEAHPALEGVPQQAAAQQAAAQQAAAPTGGVLGDGPRSSMGSPSRLPRLNAQGGNVIAQGGNAPLEQVGGGAPGGASRADAGADQAARKASSGGPRRQLLAGTVDSMGESVYSANGGALGFGAKGTPAGMSEWDKVMSSLAASQAEQQSLQALFDNEPINALLNQSGAGAATGELPPLPGTKPSKSKSRQGRPKLCNCKNSRCLKLYCECFAASVLCNGCKCVNCLNTENSLPERDEARKQVLQRNPKAFNAKFTSAESEVAPTRKHVKGCKCKNSKCLKNYCECFQMGVNCTSKCKCKGCENGKVDDPGKSAMPNPLLSASGTIRAVLGATVTVPAKIDPKLRSKLPPPTMPDPPEHQFADVYAEGSIEEVMHGIDFDELDDEQNSIFAMNALMCNEDMESPSVGAHLFPQQQPEGAQQQMPQMPQMPQQPLQQPLQQLVQNRLLQPQRPRDKGAVNQDQNFNAMAMAVFAALDSGGPHGGASGLAH